MDRDTMPDVRRYLRSPWGKVTVVLNLVGLIVSALKIASSPDAPPTTLVALLPVPYDFQPAMLNTYTFSAYRQPGDYFRVVQIIIPRAMPNEDIYTHLRLVARTEFKRPGVRSVQAVALYPGEWPGDNDKGGTRLTLAPYGNLLDPPRDYPISEYKVVIQDRTRQ